MNKQHKMILVGAIIFSILFYMKWRFGPQGFANQEGVDTFALYYADWCPHCKTVKPEFKKLADKGSVQVNGKTVFVKMFEADTNPEDIQKAGVKGFPTFKLHKADGKTVEYNGERNMDGWMEFLKKQIS